MVNRTRRLFGLATLALMPGILFTSACITPEMLNPDNALSAAAAAAAATTAPSAPDAATIYVEGVNSTEVLLSWYGPSGSPTQLDMRYGLTEITDANFASMLHALGISTPAASGVFQTGTIDSLTNGTQYYFAMKSSNAVGSSPISNTVNVTTGFGLHSVLGRNGDGWSVGNNAEWNPYDIVISSDNTIYVCDYSNNRVAKLDSSGKFLAQLGGGVDGWSQSRVPLVGGLSEKYFKDPVALAFDSSENIYVVEPSAARVSKWTKEGVFLGWFGKGNLTTGWHAVGSGETSSSGSGKGEFNMPYDIVIDSSDTIYIADFYNNRIQKWTTSGTYLGWFGKGNLTTGWHDSDNTETPTNGSLDQQLYYPLGVGVDRSNNMYAMDYYNYRIQKWNSAGTYLGWYGKGNLTSGWHATPSGETPASGTADGQFTNPADVSFDSNDNMYVTDYMNARVQKWNSSGEFLGWYGKGSVTTGWHAIGSVETAVKGFGNQEFRYPMKIAHDASGNRYVIDSTSLRISKWTSNDSYAGTLLSMSSGFTTDLGYVGKGDGKINYPTGLALTDTYIYVFDRANVRLQKWTLAGAYQGWLGNGASGWTTGDAPAWADTSAYTGDAKFSTVDGDIEVDGDGNIYVADTWNNRVQKWTAAGEYLGFIGGGGNGWHTGVAPGTTKTDKYLCRPFGIKRIGSYLYIVERNGQRVQKWNLDGTYVGWIGNGVDGWHTGTGVAGSTADKKFNDPYDIDYDADNNLYILDSKNFRVQKWTLDGTCLGWIGGGVNGWQTGVAPATGSGDGQFGNLGWNSIVIDRASSIIYISDSINYRIQKWNTAGTFIGFVGDGASGWRTGSVSGVRRCGNFGIGLYISGMALGADGFLYVSDGDCNRVSRWK